MQIPPKPRAALSVQVWHRGSEKEDGCTVGEEESGRWLWASEHLPGRRNCNPATKWSLTPRWWTQQHRAAAVSTELQAAWKPCEKSYFDPSLTFKKHSHISSHYKKSCAGVGQCPPEEAEAFCNRGGNTHTANTSRTLGRLGGQHGLEDRRGVAGFTSLHLLHQLSGGCPLPRQSVLW